MPAVSLSPIFNGYQGFTINGLPNAGGLVSTYLAGTSTPSATYTTNSGSVANPVQIQLDASGHPPQEIWLVNGIGYRFVVTDALGLNSYTYDNISGSAGYPNLANTADPTQGAGLIGFNDSLTYAQGTVGARLGEYKSVRDLPYGAVGNGTTDDTAAITAAVSGGGNVVIPAGYTFKISSYIQIPSNTTLLIYGTVQITNRNAGFFTNGASNVGIYGFKTGTFTDPSVQAAYSWNPVTIVAPCIHIRSSDNVVIDGLNLSWVRQGLLVSNAAQTTSFAGSWTLNQTAPTNVTLSNNRGFMVEGATYSCYNGLQITYNTNFVGYSGDGGLWMMGAQRSLVVNNKVSLPQTVASDVATFGSNNLAHPTTWNNIQGMEFENCHLLDIVNNDVENIAQLPIDIKNGCSEVNVINNKIWQAESAGIVCREGDAVKNANIRVTISGNQIFNTGTSQNGAPAGPYQGCIFVANTYLASIDNNAIHSYQLVPGIVAAGPGSYQASQFPSNPSQAAVVVSNNKIWFKNNFQETVPAFNATSATMSAIVLVANVDSITCVGNLIKADRFQSADSRFSTTPAISLTYQLIGSFYYPGAATITGNSVSNWIGRGIEVTDLFGHQNSGLIIEGNAISGVADIGIHTFSASGVVIGHNNVSNVGHGSGQSAIFCEGPGGGNPCTNIKILGNNVFGRQDGGTNTMTTGIALDSGQDCKIIANDVRVFASSALAISSPIGEIIIRDCPGFPRQLAGSPAGSVLSFFNNEDYYDTTAGKWWKSSAARSNSAWTQISN